MERNPTSSRRGRGSNHVWTTEEDAKLIEALLELKEKGTFNGENGNGFTKGYKKEIERMLQEKLPGHGLREKPHIESRCKLLKKQYHAIYDVKNNRQESRFGWDDERKCLTATADVWDDYVKSHPDSSFLRNRPFIYYDQLAIIWGKNRATGNDSEAPGDILESLDNEENNDTKGSDSDDIGDSSNPREPQGEKSSTKTHRKRKRSTDKLVLGLECMTDMFTSHFKENSNNLAKMAETIAAHDQHRIENKHKLNDEL